MSLPESEKWAPLMVFCLFFCHVSHDRKMNGAPGKLPQQLSPSCESAAYRSVLH